jgi:hypothetical protein
MAYIWHAMHRFSYSGSALNNIVCYIIAHLIGYIYDVNIIYLSSDRLGYPYQLVRAIVFLTVVAMLFFLFRCFVFSKPTLASAGLL